MSVIMATMFCCLSLFLSMMFMFMSHPLAMGLALLVQTLLLSISTGLILPTFWFSYILFLVFLGGMLVLFIYVASLASNEMFSFSLKTASLIFMASGVTLITIMITDPSLFNSLLSFVNMNHLPQDWDLFNMFVFKMYNVLNHMLTLMMIIYLLLALVIVANIVTVQEGPLRPLT